MPVEESQSSLKKIPPPPGGIFYSSGIKTYLAVRNLTMLICANGDITHSRIYKPEGSIVIAADGGARHCMASGIIPHVVIGDFDSLTGDELARLENSGAKIIRYPTDKDETDLELALTYAVEHGASVITFLGLLGGRWDMSFANILLLSSPRFQELHFRIIVGDTEMFILHGGDTLDLGGIPGDTVSVIPLSNRTTGITYTGLEWPLEDASIDFGSPRGVSNRMSSENAQIYLDSGVLLVIIIHQPSSDQSPGFSEFHHRSAPRSIT
jgi:thiamine pyrophosphokinase